jgi:hypothetical protein
MSKLQSQDRPAAMPRRFQRILERVTARDKQYFLEHPGKVEYYRPYVPGETWPYWSPECTHTLVKKIAPGLRTRQFLKRGGVNDFFYS